MNSQWLHPWRNGTVKPSENTKYSCSFRAVPRFVLFWVHFFLLSLLDKCLLILQSQPEMPPPPPHSFFSCAFSKLRGDLDTSSLSQRSSYLCHTGTQLRLSILLVPHWHTAKTLYFGSIGWKLHSLCIVPGLPHLWNYAEWRKLEHVVLEGKAGSLLKYLLAFKLPSVVIL